MLSLANTREDPFLAEEAALAFTAHGRARTVILANLHQQNEFLQAR
jgi:hypothetical protein